MKKYNLTAQGLPKFKTGTFNAKGKTFKTPKFKPRTSTMGKLGKYALGAYIASQIFGGGRGQGILPPADRRKEIVAGKGGDINFTLAGTRKSK